MRKLITMEEKNNSILIKSFYEQLDEELETFTLPMDKLLASCEFIVYEYIGTDLAGIAGLREGHWRFTVVKKKYQNRGLGQKLRKRTEDRARENRFSYIQSNVSKTNARSLHINKKEGFMIISSVEIDGADSYYMIKPLTFKGHLIIFIKRSEAIFKKFLLKSRGKKKLRQGEEEVKN